MGLPENHVEAWSFPHRLLKPAPVELAEEGERQAPRPALAVRVRRLIEEELPSGNPSKEHIAERMGMSARTLCRRLSEDGTTFVEVLNELRRELALRYIENQSSSMSEVASRLGFSSVSAFGRAFRRWTGLSPTAYAGSPVGAQRQTD